MSVIAFEVLFLAHHGSMAGALPAHSDWPTDPTGAPIHLPMRSPLRAAGLITLIVMWALPAAYKFMIPLILNRRATPLSIISYHQRSSETLAPDNHWLPCMLHALKSPAGSSCKGGDSESPRTQPA